MEMDSESFLFALFTGIFLIIVIAHVYFIDYIGILLKIFPKRRPRGIEKEEKLQKSPLYKKHKRKWRALYSLNSLVYTAVFTAAAFIIRNMLISFFLGFIAIAISWYKMFKLEQNQLHLIKTEIFNYKNYLDSESK